MLQQHGYIDKSKKIELHKRAGACCSKTDPVILTLYPDTFMLSPETVLNKSIYQSMKDIYEQRKGSSTPTYVLPKPTSINVSTDIQVKNAVAKQYSNLEQVVDEIHRLKGIGVPEGLLSDTYMKIVERNRHLR